MRLSAFRALSPLLLTVELLDVLEAAPDLVGGVRNLVGVVDDARREKDDQFGPGFADALGAEGGSQYGNAVQQRHAAGALGVGFLYEAADGYRIAVLHRELGAEGPVREGRRLNAVRGRRYRRAHLLVDDHRDYAARVDAGGDGQRHPRADVVHRVRERAGSPRRDAADHRLRGEHGDGLTHVHGGRNTVGGDDAGSGYHARVLGGLAGLEHAQQLVATQDQRTHRDTQAARAGGRIQRARDRTPRVRTPRVLLLQVRTDAGRERAAQVHLVNLGVDENLAGRHVELPQQGVDLLVLLWRALNQQSVIERIGYDVGNSGSGRPPHITTQVASGEVGAKPRRQGVGAGGSHRREIPGR